MEQYFFRAKNNTNCFVTIKGNFVFRSIVTTNIQKTLESNTGAEQTYIISKHQMIHKRVYTYISEYYFQKWLYAYC